MFLNVFYSWLIAQVLHPFVFMLSIWIFDGSTGYMPWFLSIYFFLFSAVASLPCLLLGWLCLGMIICSDYTFVAKFLVWLVTAGILVIFNFWIIFLLFDDALQPKDLLIAAPAIVSIWIASIIRLKQFQKLDITEKSVSEDQLNFETAGEDQYTKNH